ncbi:MAG: glycosyltransferase [Scytonema sp. RU_4_4]|nr:glycosyltransferase [Scytonema sp. RU_4_4]NJR76806.1 glycosyltransferase [Scytonema sp. CRU_2_7]
MTPTISIVTTVYNRERYVGAAIESILNQTRRDFELLIWDDGSTDGSLEIARNYAALDPRIRVIAAEHQRYVPSLKAAFAATTGSYIGSVDSDDLLAPTALEETAAILDAHPEVGMVYTDHHVINENGQDRGLGARCYIPYSKDRMLVDFMTFHFRLLRRCVYDQVGGLDESFEQSEDYDLCLRLSEVTAIYHVQKPLYYYRRHAGNMSNQRQEALQWGYRASLKALKRRGLDKRYQLELLDTDQLLLRRKETLKN